MFVVYVSAIISTIIIHEKICNRPMDIFIQSNIKITCKANSRSCLYIKKHIFVPRSLHSVTLQHTVTPLSSPSVPLFIPPTALKLRKCFFLGNFSTCLLSLCAHCLPGYQPLRGCLLLCLHLWTRPNRRDYVRTVDALQSADPRP